MAMKKLIVLGLLLLTLASVANADGHETSEMGEMDGGDDEVSGDTTVMDGMEGMEGDTTMMDSEGMEGMEGDTTMMGEMGEDSPTEAENDMGGDSETTMMESGGDDDDDDGDDDDSSAETTMMESMVEPPVIDPAATTPAPKPALAQVRVRANLAVSDACAASKNNNFKRGIQEAFAKTVTDSGVTVKWYDVDVTLTPAGGVTCNRVLREGRRMQGTSLDIDATIAVTEDTVASAGSGVTADSVKASVQSAVTAATADSTTFAATLNASVQAALTAFGDNSGLTVTGATITDIGEVTDAPDMDTTAGDDDDSTGGNNQDGSVHVALPSVTLLLAVLLRQLA